MREIHQVLVGAGPGDAITSMALAIRGALRSRVVSEIYALHVDPAIQHEVLPLGAFPTGSGSRLAIFHASIGEPTVAHFLLSNRLPLVLVYHNMTPSKYFAEIDTWVMALLEYGRAELALLRPQVRLAVADSAYNASELEVLGFEDARVMPAGLDPYRLLGELPDPDTGHWVDGLGHPVVLGVSQHFPHKRHELLIQATYLLRRVHGVDAHLALAGTPRHRPYFDALELHAQRLLCPAHFLGRVSDRALATLYRRSAVLAIASEHEGLGVPAIEAMAFGLPVVARACGALPETIGDGGLVLPADAGASELAEALAAALNETSLRNALALAGATRATELARAGSPERFAALIEEL